MYAHNVPVFCLLTNPPQTNKTPHKTLGKSLVSQNQGNRTGHFEEM